MRISESNHMMQIMVNAYLEAIIFTEEERLEEESPNGVTWSQEAIVKAHEHCTQFLQMVEETVEESDFPDITAESMGHDLWLTRNRHGVGFWDRGYGQLGKYLTEKAQSMGEINVFASEGGYLQFDK